MKTMILVWGTSKRGKSQGLKRLSSKFPFATIIRPWSGDDYDSFIIGTVNDSKGDKRVIGMESLGDPGSCQKLWIEECVNAGCEVVVAASRCYGQTYNDAYEIARANGYEVIEVTTHFHRGGYTLPNGVDLRDAFADNIQSLIMMCL